MFEWRCYMMIKSSITVCIVALTALLLSVGAANAQTSNELESGCTNFYEGTVQGPGICSCLVQETEGDEELQKEFIAIFKEPGAASAEVVEVMTACVQATD